MTGAPLIEAAGLHTYYGASHVLHGIDLTLRRGETVALLGRNGMGKTTLLRSLLGLTPPRRGARAHRRPRHGRRPGPTASRAPASPMSPKGAAFSRR